MEGGGWRAGGVARVAEEEVESRDDEGQERSRFIHLLYAHLNQLKPAASAVEPPDLLSTPVQVEPQLLTGAERIQPQSAAPL